LENDVVTFRNREYQKRATRQGIRSFLAQEFYRPAVRPVPGEPRTRDPERHRDLGLPAQMSLIFDDPTFEEIFPESYFHG
jgi:hypothetical protein